MLRKIHIVFGSILLMLAVVSCKKFVTIPPPGSQLDQSKVFQNEASALAALSGVYYSISENIYGFASGSSGSITITMGIYSDEIISYLTDASAGYYFYNNILVPTNGSISAFWSNAYSGIYECNRIIEGLNESNAFTADKKNQLKGEALFLRAFCHFYLAASFGNIPLIITSDYAKNTSVSRTEASLVYQQIISDLLTAKELLSDTYPSNERVRVNKGAAIALLSRAYLFSNDYANAESNASEIIGKSTQYKLMTDLNTVFLNTSEEAIWQFLPYGGFQDYTNEGFLFLLKAVPPTRYSLRNSFYTSFETDDKRRLNWADSIVSTSGLSKWYFPNKYKQNSANATGDEYSMVLRLAEQYLIRAEARVKRDKLSEARADIDAIRSRAGLTGTTAVTQEELMAAIEKERYHELFTEWGHRFYDLKRWKKLDENLNLIKPNWNSTDSLLPIPQSEILLNKNLTQNDGYN